MTKEKTLETVPSEDEIKDTDEQSEEPLQDDEELTDDVSDESDTEDEAPKEKRFKSREERAEFFKNKKRPADSDVVTKADLFKINERKAIREATTPSDSDSPELKKLKGEINDNWDSIIAHFNPSVDRSDVDLILEGIMDAHTVWRRRTGGTKDKDTTDVDARAELMADAGAKGSTGKGAAAQKKSVLGKQSKGMDDWYPAKDN